MPNLSDIHRLVSDMHEKKILNSATTIDELLSVKADHITNPGVLAGWYALGGDHYVVVCGKNPIEAIADGKGGGMPTP